MTRPTDAQVQGASMRPSSLSLKFLTSSCLVPHLAWFSHTGECLQETIEQVRFLLKSLSAICWISLVTDKYQTMFYSRFE